MKALPSIVLASLGAAAATWAFAAAPLAGSRLPEDKNACAACHGDPGVWDADRARLLISKERLAEDVHFLNGVNCHDCHGGNPTSFDVPEAHAALVNVKDPNNQVQLCGRCHPQDLESYTESMHGYGLRQVGLSVTAVCASCHGAHGVYRTSDKRSTLHPDRVAATCAKCHGLIEQRLQNSVHRRDERPGEKATALANAGRKPSCTDCHQGHDLPSPKSANARLSSSDRCGSCHAEFSVGYSISMHGALTKLGYGPAAKCHDCHGAHDVLKVSNPDSRLSASHRRETCEKCHPDATQDFADFDPHADHRDPDRDPVLHGVYLVLMTLLLTTFGGFGLHSLLWLIRGTIDVFKHGRPRSLVPGTVAYVRFGPFHRVAHTVMVLSFLGLAMTGLPLKYSHQGWAQVLAQAFGGFESTGYAHRIFAAMNIGCLVVYVVRMLGRVLAAPPKGRSRMSVVFGDDSPVPNLRDVKDFFKMVRWFLGLGPKPTFERWSYWEKFDFWGACADIVIIGATGLILWFPDLTCAYLPGKTLNIAKVIHSTQALLATGFVFAIHFFNTHMRPEKFPMDLSILTGRVSVEELHEERPEYLERMRREGKLEQLKAEVPPREVLSFAVLSGTVALLAGLGLLAGIVLAAMS